MPPRSTISGTPSAASWAASSWAEWAHLLRAPPPYGPRISAGLAAQGMLQGTTLNEQWWRDAQTALDAADPINFIALATTGHPIHVIQVVGSATPPSPSACIAQPTPAGCPDQVVPNSATQRLILAGGLTQVHPPGAAGTTALHVYVNFTAGAPGSIMIEPSCPAALPA